MPFLTARAPLRGRSVYDLRSRAAVLEEPSTGRSKPALKRLGLIFGLSVLMERVNVRGSNVVGCDSANGAAKVIGGIVRVFANRRYRPLDILMLVAASFLRPSLPFRMADSTQGISRASEVFAWAGWPAQHVYRSMKLILHTPYCIAGSLYDCLFILATDFVG